MLVVGSVAQGSAPDRLQRWTLAPGTGRAQALSSPCPGSRAWLVTPRGEWVCAGDDALLRHDGTGWVPEAPRVGSPCACWGSVESSCSP